MALEVIVLMPEEIKSQIENLYYKWNINSKLLPTILI